MPREPGAAIDRRTCPLCNGADLQGQVALGHRRLARCRRCAHEFVAACEDEALAAEYRAAYYANDEDPRIAAWAAEHEPVWDGVVEQMLALHPAAASVLDVGSGSGGFLLRLRARRPDLTLGAVEPAGAARTALARRLPDLTFPAEVAEQLENVGARFDVVTMLQTLEHLRDPLLACRGALHCLRPGGLLLITVPNRRSLAVWRHGRAADCYANGTHLHFFSRATLSRLLLASGFARVRRVVAFGGGQHAALLPAIAQYLARLAGRSTELRVAAWRP